jgi:hypothetical protein
MAKKKAKAGGEEGRPRKQRTEYNVSAREFIAAWQSSETAGEVAKKLKMPKPIVFARASGYRSDGIKLKKLRRESRRQIDVDDLNRLIQHLEAGGTLESYLEEEKKEAEG